MLTYGWVFLVIGVMIAGLAYFMPSTKSLTSNKCIFGSAIPCLGTQLTAANLTIVLRNGLGQSIYNISVNTTVPINRACIVSNSTLIADDRLVITCQNTGMLNLNKDTRIMMSLSYKKVRGGYDQTIIGDVYAKYSG